MKPMMDLSDEHFWTSPNFTVTFNVHTDCSFLLLPTMRWHNFFSITMCCVADGNFLTLEKDQIKTLSNDTEMPCCDQLRALIISKLQAHYAKQGASKTDCMVHLKLIEKILPPCPFLTWKIVTTALGGKERVRSRMNHIPILPYSYMLFLFPINPGVKDEVGSAGWV